MGRDPVVGEDRVRRVDPVAVVEQHHSDPLAAEGSGNGGHLNLGRHRDPCVFGNVGDARRLEGIIGGRLWIRLEGARANHQYCTRRLACGMCSRGGAGATQDLLASDESVAQPLHQQQAEADPCRAHGDIMNVDAEWGRDARHVGHRLVGFNADSEEQEGSPEGVA